MYCRVEIRPLTSTAEKITLRADQSSGPRASAISGRATAAMARYGSSLLSRRRGVCAVRAEPHWAPTAEVARTAAIGMTIACDGAPPA